MAPLLSALSFTAASMHIPRAIRKVLSFGEFHFTANVIQQSQDPPTLGPLVTKRGSGNHQATTVVPTIR